MNIPLFLSGNFGELRTNHFHSGLDIKTQGVEGKPIYACADGYISRIKKSPWGYGNVVYINHPNGYTTVYAHLSKFNKTIEEFYIKVQNRKQQFHVDLYPGPDIIPVKKGDIIALSGNSGSSGGPHLHFEIRNTDSENPLNPMLFGFKIKDNIPPKIKGLRIYAFAKDSLAGICNKSHVVIGSGGKYSLKTPKTILLDGSGLYGFAAHATDMLNGSGNICGVYDIKLFFDDELIFSQQIDTLDFYTSRYMNAHTDYALYKETKKSYHKSFIEPNNKLVIYKSDKNRGLVNITDQKTHNLYYQIRDVSGNLSTLNFSVRNTKAIPIKTSGTAPLILCCDNSEFKEEEAHFYFPPGIVYNHTPYVYKQTEQKPGRYSKTHTINTTDIPVQQKYTIRIKSSIPTALAEKGIVVEENNGRYYARGGTYKDGWITARVRSFGTYSVMVDKTPPRIEFKNLTENKLFTGNVIYITAQDNLSGIKTYNAFINGNWAPAEYLSKKGKYVIKLSNLNLPSGNNTIKFTATDERGNSNESSLNFRR